MSLGFFLAIGLFVFTLPGTIIIPIFKQQKAEAAGVK